MQLIKKKFVVSKYIKSFIKEGKKEKAEHLFKLTFSFIKKAKKVNPLIMLLDFIKKARPFCEVKSIKIKGSLQGVPIEIKQNRQKSLILRWLVTNERKENTIVDRISKELLDTVNLQSRTVKLCDEMHKIAETNKTFIQVKN
jgi:small subunit ribosomal protein S7